MDCHLHGKGGMLDSRRGSPLGYVSRSRGNDRILDSRFHGNDIEWIVICTGRAEYWIRYAAGGEVDFVEEVEFAPVGFLG